MSNFMRYFWNLFLHFLKRYNHCLFTFLIRTFYIQIGRMPQIPIVTCSKLICFSCSFAFRIRSKAQYASGIMNRSIMAGTTQHAHWCVAYQLPNIPYLAVRVTVSVYRRSEVEERVARCSCSARILISCKITFGALLTLRLNII